MSMNYPPFTGLLAALLLITPGTVGAGSKEAPRESGDLQTRVTATLARHVDGAQTEAYLAQLDEGSLERQAAEWILAWLPTADLIALRLPLLREHVTLAAQAYRQAPWRDRLPRELWLRFVVPHRVSQEPPQPWRGHFFRELWPRVQDAGSMELAALEVNRWCREHATFKSTSRRDMGPLTTIARGIGRCEEEMILTIAALRSVGIPARSCATPYWTFCDNNHAWVEAWADGHWYYLGGCEPGHCLNDAWFTGAARRAGFVRSVGYGEFDPLDEPLYRAEDGSTLINSTAVYTDPFTLTVSLDEPAKDDARIYVNVLNFGSLRPLASVEAGQRIQLGPGEYALTAAGADSSVDLLVKIVRGKPGDEITVTLSSEDRYDFTASPGFWLRYPEADQVPRRDLELVEPETKALHELRIRARDDDRLKLRTPNAREAALLDTLDSATRARLDAILEVPFERVSTIFLLWEHYSDPTAREALLAFLEGADDKDLLELSAADIRGHIDHACAVRERLADAGLPVPDSLFYDHVLPARIAWEAGGNWRPGLPLIPLAQNADESLERLLAAYREQIDPVERGFFGHLMSPSDCWAVGLGSESEMATTLVGLLRRNGFPARWRHGIVETWVGEWVRLDPKLGELHAADDSAESPEEERPGILDIAITRGGLPYEQAQAYTHFNVCRPKVGYLESPWWEPRLGPQEWDAGEYFLCSAMRVPGGSIYGRLRSFSITAGETTRVALPVDIDPADWDSESALISDLTPGAVTTLLETTTVSGSAYPNRGLFFFFEPGEPASRMITALGRLWPRLDKLDLPFSPVLVGEVDTAPWRTALTEAGFPEVLWQDATARRAHLLNEASAFDPIVLLYLPDRARGEIVMLRQGFDSAVDGTVHLALDLLDAEASYGQ